MAAILLAGSPLAANPQASPDASPEAPPFRAEGLDQPTVTFVLGNLEFVLLHELAHVVIGELKVPVLGPEEDAADYLAATSLLVVTRDEPADHYRASQYLLAAAEGLGLAWEAGNAQRVDVPYWNSHSLNIQRFYTVACLLYGSDPRAFQDLPARTRMPAARAQGCAAEWAKSDHSFRWLLETYGRRPAEPLGPEIRIVYERPESLVATELLAEVRRDGLLERVAQRVREKIVLPRALAFVMRSCGRPEAAWQPKQRELVLCYELLDTFYRMSSARPPVTPAPRDTTAGSARDAS